MMFRAEELMGAMLRVALFLIGVAVLAYLARDVVGGAMKVLEKILQ